MSGADVKSGTSTVKYTLPPLPSFVLSAEARRS